jgi:hypothetical protein
LKEKVYHDGHYQIFYSKQHEHQPLENTNLPIQIRPLVRNLALKGLTIAQIKETMKVLHPHISIDTKIRNIVQYEQRVRVRVFCLASPSPHPGFCLFLCT